MTDWVVGLDLSLSCTGICGIPSDWDGCASKCDVLTAKSQPSNDLHVRCRDIAHRIAAIMPDGSVTVGIEALRGRFSQAKLGILHGHVVSAIMHMRPDISIIADAPISTARKLILGEHMVRASEAKRVVSGYVTSAPGCAGWGSDEIDAFVIANYVVSQSTDWPAWRF